MSFQVEVLESLQYSEKQLLSIKDFISKRRLNLEIENELKRIEKEEQIANRRKMLYKWYKQI